MKGELAKLRTVIETLYDRIEEVGLVVTDVQELVNKNKGMLNFCYAICNNDAIKKIADENRPAAKRLDWGGIRGANRGNNNGGDQASPGPRMGLGSAGRPF